MKLKYNLFAIVSLLVCSNSWGRDVKFASREIMDANLQAIASDPAFNDIPFDQLRTRLLDKYADETMSDFGAAHIFTMPKFDLVEMTSIRGEETWATVLRISLLFSRIIPAVIPEDPEGAHSILSILGNTSFMHPSANISAKLTSAELMEGRFQKTLSNSDFPDLWVKNIRAAFLRHADAVRSIDEMIYIFSYTTSKELKSKVYPIQNQVEMMKNWELVDQFIFQMIQLLIADSEEDQLAAHHIFIKLKNMILESKAFDMENDFIPLSFKPHMPGSLLHPQL